MPECSVRMLMVSGQEERKRGRVGHTPRTDGSTMHLAGSSREGAMMRGLRAPGQQLQRPGSNRWPEKGCK